MQTLVTSPLTELDSWVAELPNNYNTYSADLLERAASRAFRVSLADYLGAGDNGIAYLTDAGSVVKFTIDAKEAALWGRIARQQLPGIVDCYGVRRLDYGGELYLVHVAYAVEPLDDELAGLILAADELAQRRITRAQAASRATDFTALQATEYAKAFRSAAAEDQRLEGLASLIAYLFQAYGAAVYDFQPDNMRIDQNGQVVLIDPSVPNFTTRQPRPAPLSLEDKLIARLQQLLRD